ncbi:DUF2975 domain-containing protein [Roseicyclus persicicus]|uniref:DUF2975 domain-containing protein n=1 Tax=Roseicyclus persicicus TaxID=2650661 RepID=A0A7X6GYA9_9RHOB|nr:DUF2975 domain-containing protein [Roseibacterium persicicum]NKX44646.1 DUF2975 domain-containing protein [Roseibacterium persicicum]
MPDPTPLARVQRLSRFFSRLALGLGALLVLLDVLVWLDRDALERGAALLLPEGTAYALTPVALAGGFVMGHLVLGLLLVALWQAHRLFAAFARGEILVPESGARLFRIGLAFALVLPAQMLGSAVASVLLTLGNPPGERVLSISVDPAHAMLAAAGLLILTVGWVMAEAARIADDNAQIV